MSTFKYLLTAAAVLPRLSQTSACSCLPPGTLCDSVLNTDVVLHVKALERADGPDINDDAVYTLETIEVFKGEEPGPNEYDEVGATFEMTTGGNSALCGVFMKTDGTEYLIDIGRQSDGTLYADGICGLFREWREEDRATLEEGCDDYDPCDGECGEFEECVRSYDLYAEDTYYCQDTCDPSPCLDGETCTLVYPPCSATPCVAEATCGEGEPPSPSLPPAGTLPPGGYIETPGGYVVTPPPGGYTDGDTPPPSSGTRDPPIDGDGRGSAEPETPPPAPGTGGPPSSTPRTASPTAAGKETPPPAPGTGGPPSSTPRTASPTAAGKDETRPTPAAAPTVPPRGDVPSAPNASEPPTTGRDSSTASPTAASDGSRGGVSITDTAAPSTALDAGGASPLPEVTSAPTVSANAEGDPNAAPAVRSSGGFVAATAVVVATAAAACASF